MKKRIFFLKCLYEGDVQGVGFRYKAFQFAQTFPVKGFIKNMPDGRVQLEVEGESTDVLAFKKALDQAMTSHIQHTTVENTWRTASFASFDIAH
ncbi:MAG: hypothetical protein A2Y14_04550 [Verrucomicrobia bacterium GWF2_51_19]|nr:MAG: hypothetical protein A2Y14_04550 [Verrucomicrobia bacterium GWF2_51_19]HCJ12518.1 acylphosphatase [Opitutae bacterium]